MNTIREIEKINQEELDRGLAGTSASWHEKYAKSAWVYARNLDHELTEGDIICVLSQYGEVRRIVDILHGQGIKASNSSRIIVGLYVID